MSESSVKSPPAEMLAAAIEAVVFAAGEAVRPREIAAAFGYEDVEQIVEALESLQREYESRGGGLQLERVAGGFRLATRPAVGAWVRRFFRQRNRTRLTPAGLETLAIVAYRQPVTAPEIQAIRGVDASGAIKNLLEKKMIRILGRKKVVGNPFLYGTTKQFLMHFGLDTLDELPSITQFEELVGHLQSIQDQVFTEDAGSAGESAAGSLEIGTRDHETTATPGEPIAE